ncbi:MAG: hypothetical protein ABIF82_15630, partial [Planctomycetota bacterium]
ANYVELRSYELVGRMAPGGTPSGTPFAAQWNMSLQRGGRAAAPELVLPAFPMRAPRRVLLGKVTMEFGA